MYKFHNKLGILSSLLENEFDSIISKYSTDVGMASLFKMDIPTTGPPTACKPYPILIKYQKFIDQNIKLLENAGCISKSSRPLADIIIIVCKKARFLTSSKQQFHIVLDYQLLNKSINSAHNGNNVISYYSLPNITDLLASEMQIIISLRSKIRISSHCPNPKAKSKTAFATTSGK